MVVFVRFYKSLFSLLGIFCESNKSLDFQRKFLVSLRRCMYTLEDKRQSSASAEAKSVRLKSTSWSRYPSLEGSHPSASTRPSISQANGVSGWKKRVYMVFVHPLPTMWLLLFFFLFLGEGGRWSKFCHIAHAFDLLLSDKCMENGGEKSSAAHEYAQWVPSLIGSSQYIQEWAKR